MNWVQSQVATPAAARTERRNLAHVDPCSIVSDFLVVLDHLIGPPSLCTLGQPVGEDCVSRPNSTNVEAAVGVPQERPGVVASLEGRVSGTLLD